MRNTIVTSIIILVALGVLTFLSTRATAADEGLGLWKIGQVISIPSPDNPLIPIRLTVLDATEWGDWTIVDQDGDVFSCIGAIAAEVCQSTGRTCPFGVALAARTPGIGNKALWMCKEAPPVPIRSPENIIQGKSCPDHQRLWVDMVNGRIVGYRCAE